MNTYASRPHTSQGVVLDPTDETEAQSEVDTVVVLRTPVQESYAPSYPARVRGGSRRFQWLLIVAGLVVVLAAGQVIWWAVYTKAPVHSSGIWLQGARSMNVTVAMGSGDLTLSGGADAENAMNAAFIYSVPEWEPEVSYQVSSDDGNARLVLQQPANETLRATNARSEWDVRLREGLPMTIDVVVGAGTVGIRLGRLAVTSLTVNNSGGDTTVDLTGNRSANLTASIVTNVGRTTIVLPTDVGVKVVAQSMLGKVNAGGLMRNKDVYTNTRYGESPVTLTIKVYSVTGDIELRQAR